MTRSDYAKIAEVMRIELNCANGHFEELALKEAVKGLADMLQRDNPRFDRAKFFHACGVF